MSEAKPSPEMDDIAGVQTGGHGAENRVLVRQSPDLWLGLLAVLAAAPLVLRYLGRLWGEEHYQYFPLLDWSDRLAWLVEVA
jgi:hypothetical protein